MEFLSLTDRDIELERVEMKCLEGTHVGFIIGHFCRFAFNFLMDWSSVGDAKIVLSLNIDVI